MSSNSEESSQNSRGSETVPAVFVPKKLPPYPIFSPRIQNCQEKDIAESDQKMSSGVSFYIFFISIFGTYYTGIKIPVIKIHFGY